MKLILTIDELKAIVAAKYGISHNFELEVYTPPKKNSVSLLGLLFSLQAAGAIPKNPTSIMLDPANKIVAIRTFRQFYFDKEKKTISLVAARDAINEWEMFVAWVNKNGLPTGTEVDMYCWRKDTNP